MSATDQLPTLLDKEVEMTFHYSVTGAPNIRGPYARVDTVPSSAEVRLKLDEDGQSVTVLAVKITGSRAKKDGTAGQLHSEAEYWLSHSWNEPPAWVIAIGERAEFQVRRWVSHTPELVQP